MKKKIDVFNCSGENLHVKKDHSKYIRNSKFACFALDSEGKLMYFNDAGQNIEGTTMNCIIKKQMV